MFVSPRSKVGICTSSSRKDLREFIDWSYHQGGEPEAHGTSLNLEYALFMTMHILIYEHA
jgi:hypothetical protein